MIGIFSLIEVWLFADFLDRALQLDAVAGRQRRRAAGFSLANTALATSGDCTLSGTTPRTVIEGSRSRRHWMPGSSTTLTLATWRSGTEAPAAVFT